MVVNRRLRVIKVMSTSQAVNYDKSNNIQQTTGTSVIKGLTLETVSSVLDLGCGTGYLTKVLSERIGPEGKVVAVDPDGERLKIAREKYSASNVEYIQADDKTFPPGQYDVIFSNRIEIHRISDKKALFSRVHQNLCPGGRFVFTTFDGEQTFPPVAQKIFNLVSPDFYYKALHEKQMFLTASEYQRLASEVGFNQVTIEVEDIVDEWKNLDAFIIAMNGVFHGQFDSAKMDSDTLRKLIEDYGKDTVVKRPTRIIKAVLTK
jgi:ubiquinone/menaquinone biosynthesis C-methylase UbiE